MYPVIRVDRRQAEAVEPLGTKSKFWFTNARGVRTLFKAEERGTGEDWAEKVACELAGLLGLPHVHYDLAFETEAKTPGVVCASIAPTPIDMRLGNQMLQVLDPDYPGGTKYHVSTHTIDAVTTVLDLFGSPPPTFNTNMPSGMRTASDVFVGYLLLDAWIANQDRHHENWAALLIDGMVYLAPTFDHGGSMARNLSDEERHTRTTSNDRNRRIPAFARRARSALYSDQRDSKALTTVAAWQAFGHHVPAAAQIWLERLRTVDYEQVRAILNEIPPGRMSAVCQEFTLELLKENRRRLLEGEAE